MSDLPQKLRQFPLHHGNEAADEIERLTAAIEEQRRIIETLNDGIGCTTTLESIRVLDERDELRAELAERDSHLGNLLARCHRDGGQESALIAAMLAVAPKEPTP